MAEELVLTFPRTPPGRDWRVPGAAHGHRRVRAAHSRGSEHEVRAAVAGGGRPVAQADHPVRPGPPGRHAAALRPRQGLGREAPRGERLDRHRRPHQSSRRRPVRRRHRLLRAGRPARVARGAAHRRRPHHARRRAHQRRFHTGGPGALRRRARVRARRRARVARRAVHHRAALPDAGPAARSAATRWRRGRSSRSTSCSRTLLRPASTHRAPEREVLATMPGTNDSSRDGEVGHPGRGPAAARGGGRGSRRAVRLDAGRAGTPGAPGMAYPGPGLGIPRLRREAGLRLRGVSPPGVARLRRTGSPGQRPLGR